MRPLPIARRFAVVLATSAILAVPVLAHAQPGIGTGGVDVAPGGGGGYSGYNVGIQGSYTEVPQASSVGQATPGTSAQGGGSGAAAPQAPSGPPTREVPFDGGTIVKNAETGEGVGVQIELSGQQYWCTEVCTVMEPATSPDIGMPPTPVSLAEVMNVVSSVASGLQIEPIDIGIVPQPVDSQTPAPVGLVGMHSWIWNQTPTEANNGNGPSHTITRTATAGAVTVNMTAVLTSLLVNYGDGSPPYVCPPDNPPYTDVVDGPWSPPAGMPSPTCNHHLERTSIPEIGGAFRPSVTSNWLVSWTAVAGAQTFGGAFPLEPTATTEVRVGEMQVLVTPGA